MAAAVLVIDVQRGLCEGEDAAWQGDAVIARINEVTRKARAAGVPVFFIQHEEAAGGLLVHGTPAWQLANGLHAEAGDRHVRKTATDSFHRTDLQAQLAQCGATELVICGMHSEFCVDTTTRRALALGFPVQLVADGHTTADKAHLSAAQIIAHHNATLANIGSFGPRARPVAAAALRF